MKDRTLIGQTPLTQFQGPNGEWSIFAILIVGITTIGTGLLWLFGTREKEKKERIEEMAKEIVDLRLEAKKCHEDRLLIHGQLAEMKLELSRLRGS